VFRVLQEPLYLKLIKAYYKTFVITHSRAIRFIKHESLAYKHFSENLYLNEEQLFLILVVNSHFASQFASQSATLKININKNKDLKIIYQVVQNMHNHCLLFALS